MSEPLTALAELVARELAKQRALQLLRPPPPSSILTFTTAGVGDAELLEAWLENRERSAA